MAVNGSAVSEVAVRLPDDSHPFGYIGGDRSKPVFLDPVWRRFLQEVVNREQATAVLANAILTEVNTQHP